MKNKVALITGSSRGIGRATAIEFAKKVYDVVINFLSGKEEAEELKEMIENENGGGASINY